VPDGIKIKIREGQQGTYAVVRRIEANGEFFDRVMKIEPCFMAIFGAQIEAIFTSLYSARTQLRAADEQLFDVGRMDDDEDGRLREEKARAARPDISRSDGTEG
jgi:deferrochelatase/peroxidase EfeB